ncbi:hypothetical protein KUTeg_003478 [Tegillarca granosa]|uniref:Uncharacterized protein n=1 Tax=Tegillarca granosa TaxID=220873 RepID=A0ABQ9FR35_TEGGR|nr:hypothetical protein KUTeg_003478 [Tegillarca granosa]
MCIFAKRNQGSIKTDTPFVLPNMIIVVNIFIKVKRNIKNMLIFILLLLCTLQNSVWCLKASVENDSCTIELGYPEKSQIDNIQTVEKGNAVLLMVVWFGGFSVVLAFLYNHVRKYIFHDAHNLDTTFDAGGRVTFSLTVVTVTSQLLWPGDFLQSSTLASKYELAGSLWYGVGVLFTLILFPMMTVHLKTNAPGAKTFLQVVYARFGKPAHIIFCIMAFVVTTIMSGHAAFKMVVKDITNELTVLIMAVIFGSYCLIGGLGTTFYISYFNAVIIFTGLLYFVWKLCYSGSLEEYEYVSMENLYNSVNCLQAPDGHFNNSFLSLRSYPGVLNGIIIFVIATAILTGKSRIAAKPAQGVMGFFVAGLLLFTVPVTMSLTSAMTYMTMSYHNHSNILTAADIDSGFITPYVMLRLMGPAGGYLLLTMMTMALMSTGSGEVMAVSSIIVYDIYKTYINPYRVCPSPTTCLLCGKEKLRQKIRIDVNIEIMKEDECECLPANNCEDCKHDVSLQVPQVSGRKYGVHYTCPRHGQYRQYEDSLIRQKAWCIVWVTLLHIPYGLFLISTDVNLHWCLYVLEVLLAPFITPLLFTLTWAKTTGCAVILGSIIGFIVSIAANLTVAALYYPGGLNDFIANTGSEFSVLAGSISGILVSTVICIVVSLCTTSVKTDEDKAAQNIQTVGKANAVLLMVVGFGGFSIVLAFLYNYVRKNIFHDAHNLDTTFDAGGLWTSRFPVVRHRCSVNTYCFPYDDGTPEDLCPWSEDIPSAAIMSGHAAFKMVVKDITNELTVLIMAVIFGSYCFIGGLGTTFYISYFNAVIIFTGLLYYVWKLCYSGTLEEYEYVSLENLYNSVNCLQAPDGHFNNSFLTFRSYPGFLNGVIIFFITTAIVYCDQANWQSRIAAKPAQGVMGFFVAGLLWLTVPVSVSLTSAMTYMTMSYNNHSNILTAADIDSGFITPYVMQRLMGQEGGYLLLTMMTMALMSTGSGEVMAMSSIIVYDIYKTYINPYRVCPSPTTCLLCGKEKLRQRIRNDVNIEIIKEDECECLPANNCEDCKHDVRLQVSGRKYGVHYTCPRHGQYRQYEDLLIRQKTWCIVWVTLLHIPFGLFLISTDANLHWCLFVLEVLLAPFLTPLLFTLTWAKTTRCAVILSSIIGFLVSIAANLTVAALYYPGGLNDFILNTGSEFSVLTGTISGALVSTVICIVVSLCTTSVKTDEDKAAQWEKTITINNPLNPWKRLYTEELKDFDGETKITQYHMAKVFKGPRQIAFIGGTIGLILFCLVLPGILVSFEKFSYENFTGWIKFNHIWCLLGAIFTIFVPPIEEFIQIWRQYKTNKLRSKPSEESVEMINKEK